MSARLISRSALALLAMTISMPAVQAAKPAPSGEILVLAQYQILEGQGAAAETGYAWSVSVSDGTLRFSGNVPAAAFQRFAAVRVGANVADDTVIRLGAPETFVNDALAAIEVAKLIESGSAGLDENGWYVDGVLGDGVTIADVETALQSAQTPAIAWRISAAGTAGAAPDAIAEVETEQSASLPTEILAETDDTEALVAGNDSQPGSIEGEEPAATNADEPGEESGISRGAGSISPPEPEPAPVLEPALEPDYVFTAILKDGETINLLGSTPASVLSDMLELDGVSIQFDRITTNPRAPAGFSDAALAGLTALSLLDAGQVILRNGTWLLSGTADIDTTSNAALAILQRETPDIAWKTLILAPPALDVCREEVAGYMAGKAILFPSAGVAPTAASLEVLPGLAERLAICPDSVVYVEGHTDADGSASANLALSIRRSEAVVDALVDLGVDPARLYAVGYGASLPVAPNSTAAGKRENRRIVFNFEDIAQPLP
jgi:hypothetical protein